MGKNWRFPKSKNLEPLSWERVSPDFLAECEFYPERSKSGDLRNSAMSIEQQKKIDLLVNDPKTGRVTLILYDFF
jgi:hypothetical protein